MSGTAGKADIVIGLFICMFFSGRVSHIDVSERADNEAHTVFTGSAVCDSATQCIWMDIPHLKYAVVKHKPCWHLRSGSVGNSFSNTPYVNGPCLSPQIWA